MARKKTMRKATGPRLIRSQNAQKSSRPSAAPQSTTTRGTDDQWAQGIQTSGHDEIAVRAYEIYLSRGGSPGSELEDWLEAEQQLQGH